MIESYNGMLPNKTVLSQFIIYFIYLRPDMTEKLLTGTLSLNTNKQTLFTPE